MKKILIFTTNDGFFLKELVLNLEKFSKYEYRYIFGFQNNNIKSTLMMFFTLGIVNSIKKILFFLINYLNKNTLKQKLHSEKFVKDEDDAALIRYIKRSKIDLVLSINYPKKINYNVIKSAKYGGINCHLGKLPDYAGLYPVARALMNDEKYLYTTTHFMDKKFDTAKIIDEIKLNIKNKNIIKIYEKIHKLSFNLIIKSLSKVFSRKANKKLLRKKNIVLLPKPKIIDLLKFKYARSC